MRCVPHPQLPDNQKVNIIQSVVLLLACMHDVSTQNQGSLGISSPEELQVVRRMWFNSQRQRVFNFKDSPTVALAIPFVDLLQPFWGQLQRSHREDRHAS